MNPVKLEIMDVDTFITEHNLLEVSSTFVKEPSSTTFDQDGLFSEKIFGEIASGERLARHGWINLRTEIIHPRIYKILIRVKRLYQDVMAGRRYARFDNTVKDLVVANEEDVHAGTGMYFFMQNIKRVKFEHNGSITHDNKVDVLTKYKSRMFMRKMLVIPAGIREYDEEAGAAKTDDINKWYSSCISLTKAIPEAGDVSSLYDPVLFGLQKKTILIYDYIHELMSGKRGFLQRKYSSRSIALATRNVITPADTNVSSPDSPQLVKSDECLMPLYQAAKGFQPCVIFQLKLLFFTPIFGNGSGSVALVNAKTGQYQYTQISPGDQDKYLVSDDIVAFINAYRDTHNRHMPVTIYDETGNMFYMYMVYRTDDSIYIVRNPTEFKRNYELNGHVFDEKKMSPMTKAEMLYIATHTAVKGKCVSITRYPFEGVLSIYPCFVKVMTTVYSTHVKYRSATSDEVVYELPFFPARGGSSTDGLVLHPAQLKNLGGDCQKD